MAVGTLPNIQIFNMLKHQHIVHFLNFKLYISSISFIDGYSTFTGMAYDSCNNNFLKIAEAYIQ